MVNRKNLKVVGIIPARGGSKGIPDKNIRPLVGQPLICYTIKAALEARLLSRVLVSTDSPHIAQIAKEYGAEVPFLRPAELAWDDTPRLPVVRHAVAYLKKTEGYRPDIIVTLQPTSPLRMAEHIDAAIEMLVCTGADAVFSVCEAEHSPYWMRRVDADGRLVPVLPGSETYLQRQDLPVVYRINGAVYAETYETVCRDRPHADLDIRALVMERRKSIDIDEDLDLRIAETQLLARIKTPAS